MHTDDENVDPIGACVGARGFRVQNIVDELFGEKIETFPGASSICTHFP